MSRHHQAGTCDQYHDPLTDVTEQHRPTARQLEVIDLLGIAPGHGQTVRLTVGWWRVVLAVEAWGEGMARAGRQTAQDGRTGVGGYFGPPSKRQRGVQPVSENARHHVVLPPPPRTGVVTTGTCTCGWTVTYRWGGHGDAADTAGEHIHQAAHAQSVQATEMSGQITVMEGRSL